MSVQVEIKGNLVFCSCGWYARSEHAVATARSHNSYSHRGNLPIWDHDVNAGRSQMTGEVIELD